MLRASRVVGRDRDLHVLARILPGAAAAGDSGGGGGAAAVTGPAGAGKSALVRAATPADGVLVGRAAPSTQDGLTPIVELAVGLVDLGARLDSPVLGAFRPAVTALLPGMDASTDGLRAEMPHSVVLGDALLRLWSTLPVPRRPVLVLEDLHWAGEACWAVTRRLLQRAASSGVGIVVTTRPEGPWWPELDHLVRSGDVVGVELAPLPPDAVAELVADCLDVSVTALSAGLLRSVEAAGGWPLLVEELLGDLERLGVLHDDRGRWCWEPRPGAVPRSLAAATVERVRALPAGHIGVIERAAVLGVLPQLDLLVASVAVTLDAGAQDVVAAIHAGVDVGVLRVDPVSGRPEFRHELIREAVLGSVLASQRRTHALALLDALIGTPGAVRDDESAEAETQALNDDSLSLAARLAVDADLTIAIGPLHLACARRLLRRGLPLAAAAAAAVAAGSSTVRVEALTCEVEALALAGEVDRALAAAARLDALPGPPPDSRVRDAVARAVALRGDWDGAERHLGPLCGPDESPGTMALAALVALERGRVDDAEALATRTLGRVQGGPDACQAIEVLGRIARGRDLDQAQHWFRRCVAVAEADDLMVWRARALHEDATVEQLRTLDVAALHRARQAAVDAGAPGLVSAIDFHRAAVLGVRFESDAALEVARGLLADARAQGAIRLEAWSWVLIAQAHAVGGHRAQAEAAATQAIALAPDDAEIAGVAVATGRALTALLAEDGDAGLRQWGKAVEALRRLPSVTPLPPWYLWPVLATVADIEGDGGARARAETAASQLRVTPGIDACLELALAVHAGRRGDITGAQACASAAQEGFARMPAFAGWRHLAYRWVAADAITAGWGDPAAWMTQAAEWFGAAGFDALGAACRGLARRAGAPQRRRGRGDAVVPAHLHRLGVTSREVDVLRLVAEGLTNADIAARLYLSPRTVKGYVEQLLAKTGAGNRTQLAARLDNGTARSPDSPTN